MRLLTELIPWKDPSTILHNIQGNRDLSGIQNTFNHTDLQTIIIDILKRIRVELESYDIVACRLVKNKNGKNPNVIVCFMNRKKTIDCLKMKKNMPYENL